MPYLNASCPAKKVKEKMKNKNDLITFDRLQIVNESNDLPVSQICSLICLPSIVIIRAPNSTPIVKSCTGWKRLSVNCKRRHDFPTPIKITQQQQK